MKEEIDLAVPAFLRRSQEEQGQYRLRPPPGPPGTVWDHRTGRHVLPSTWGREPGRGDQAGDQTIGGGGPTTVEIMEELRKEHAMTKQTQQTKSEKKAAQAQRGDEGMPDYSAMSGQQILDAFNEMAARPRTSKFSSKEEGVRACQQMWRSKRIVDEHQAREDGKAAAKKVPVKASEKVAKPAEKTAAATVPEKVQEAGEKLKARGRGPDDGARSRKLQMRIKVVTKKNPRREGTDAHRHYEAMVDGITVEDYLFKFDAEKRRTAAQWLSNTVRDGHVEVVE